MVCFSRLYSLNCAWSILNTFKYSALNNRVIGFAQAELGLFLIVLYLMFRWGLYLISRWNFSMKTQFTTIWFSYLLVKLQWGRVNSEHFTETCDPFWLLEKNYCWDKKFSFVSNTLCAFLTLQSNALLLYF